MSLVEKALQKLRANEPRDALPLPAAALPGPPAAHGDGGSRRAPTHVRPPPSDRHADRSTSWNGISAPVAGAALEIHGPSVRIDRETLVAEGVLAPEADAHRAAGDYRAIKRATLGAAFGPPRLAGADPRVVAVTSALAGDGKTHTSVNLALSVARERDYSAVLVDADVLKSHVTRLLGLSDRPGLNELLAGDSEIDVRESLVACDLPNLLILPAGARHDDASELLSSQRMAIVLEQLLQMLPRAVILMDCPPLLLTSEAQAVSARAGQVLLVVKAGHTPRQAVGDAIDLISDRDSVRLVLNQVDRSGVSEYYYSGQYGAYGK